MTAIKMILRKSNQLPNKTVRKWEENFLNHYEKWGIFNTFITKNNPRYMYSDEKLLALMYNIHLKHIDKHYKPSGEMHHSRK